MVVGGKMENQDTTEWTTIKVPRTNLYKWRSHVLSFGNQVHYDEIFKWCEDHFANYEWYSGVDEQGVKHFSFKDPKCATLFRLRWNY